MENTNARYLEPESVEAGRFITVDVSFISLRKSCLSWLSLLAPGALPLRS